MLTKKLCITCKEIKPASAFYLNNKNKGILFSSCKECTANQRKANAFSVNKSKREWDRRNPEKSRKAKRAHFEKNREKYAALARKYAKDHPEWKREQWRKRQMKKKGVGGYHTPAQFELVKKQQKQKCYYCGETKRLVRDHVHPISKGGSDSISNIVAACYQCNGLKNNRMMDDFVALVLSRTHSCSPSVVAFALRFKQENPLLFWQEQLKAEDAEPLFSQGIAGKVGS